MKNVVTHEIPRINQIIKTVFWFLFISSLYTYLWIKILEVECRLFYSMYSPMLSVHETKKTFTSGDQSHRLIRMGQEERFAKRSKSGFSELCV